MTFWPATQSHRWAQAVAWQNPTPLFFPTQESMTGCQWVRLTSSYQWSRLFLKIKRGIICKCWHFINSNKLLAPHLLNDHSSSVCLCLCGQDLLLQAVIFSYIFSEPCYLLNTVRHIKMSFIDFTARFKNKWDQWNTMKYKSCVFFLTEKLLLYENIRIWAEFSLVIMEKRES